MSNVNEFLELNAEERALAAQHVDDCIRGIRTLPRQMRRDFAAAIFYAFCAGCGAEQPKDGLRCNCRQLPPKPAKP